jgi:hypothetical protein
MQKSEINKPNILQSVQNLLITEFSISETKASNFVQKHKLILSKNGAIKKRNRFYINDLEKLRLFIFDEISRESVFKFITRKCKYIKDNPNNFIREHKTQLINNGAQIYGQTLYVKDGNKLENYISSTCNKNKSKTEIALLSYLEQMHFENIIKAKLFIRIYRKQLKELGTFYIEDKQYFNYCDIEELKILVKDYLDLRHRK